MNPELIEKIESYIHREIDRTALEAYARDHGVADLEEKIEWVQSVALAFEIDDVRSQIGDIAGQVREDDTPVIALKRRRWTIGIAASVLLVAVLFWLNRDVTDITERYGFQDPGVGLVMGETDNYPMYDALTYFGEGDYATAIEKLSALPKPHSDTTGYYLGASYYYAHKWKEALSYLDKIAGNPDSEFMERAEWLLVMIALNEDRTADAVSMLTDITSRPDHLFYTRALELQNELKD